MPDLDDRGQALIARLETGDLEAAAGFVSRRSAPAVAAVLRRLMDKLRRQEEMSRLAGEFRQARRLKRRHRALAVFEAGGLDLNRLLPAVRLPEGYAGKILLVGLCGGLADGRILLRGGDDWHRDILRETAEEVADCGLSRARVDALGGAWLRFEDNAAIALWGGSDEFGACDRQLATELIREAYPRHVVRVIE